MRKSRQFSYAWLIVLVMLSAALHLLAGGGRDAQFDRVKTRLALFLSDRIDNVNELCFDLRERQAEWIELVPPGMPLLVQGKGITYFMPNKFPKAMRLGLVPELHDGVTVYPVIVYEDPDTRDIVMMNSEGREIYYVPAADDYDPRWLALANVPDLYDGSRSDEDVEHLLYRYDPARVAVEYLLITKADLLDYLPRKSARGKKKRDGDGSSNVMPTTMAPAEATVSSPQCRAIEIEADGVRLTIAYPEGFSNRLDLFSCTNLMDYLWRLRWDSMDTPPGTNQLGWLDTDGAPRTRFYAVAAANCDPQTDPDGDGLTTAREKLLHNTDPKNADSDGDGMPDGWEVMHTLNPLLDDGSDDLDGDGWNNLREYKRGGNPSAPFVPDTNNALGLILMTPVRGTD